MAFTAMKVNNKRCQNLKFNLLRKQLCYASNGLQVLMLCSEWPSFALAHNVQMQNLIFCHHSNHVLMTQEAVITA